MIITVLAAVLVGGDVATGQTPWYEGFEGPETSWQPAGGDGQFQILAHRRVREGALTGDGCEHVALSGTGGTHCYLSHDVGRPRVIDELLPTVQVRSDRTGLQILARIVLARTKDPQTGRPISTLVRGSSYTTVGRWQQLRIEDVPELLAQQTRILRAELGPDIDPREAYIDRILLNVYGGPGVTNVWIDDLDISGHVGPQPGMADFPSAGHGHVPPNGRAADSGRSSPGGAPALAVAGPTGGGTGAAGSRRLVELEGSVLLTDGRPMFPRAIQYQGESLDSLQRLGFNAVWLAELPSSEIIDEANRLGLWLVCPPPRPPETAGPESLHEAPAPIGPRYNGVLAWNLGRQLSTGELEATKQWAELVRAGDRQNSRPLICGPESDLRKYSRYVDFLLMGRSPLGSSLKLTDYGTWLRERPRLALPGKPFWSTVQTQPALSVRRQLSALGLGRAPPGAVSSEQIRLLTYTAVAAGSRGLLFESDSPLDAADTYTRIRASALELLNLELTLIEPWLKVGELVTTVGGSEREVVGAVLRTDRARLLVPIWSGKDAQFVPGQSAGNSVSFVVPGVPESDNAYQLGPGSLEPLRHKRVTGGVRVTLDEFGLTSLVLLTGEPLVLSSMRQRAHEIGRRAAQLQRELAVAKLQEVEQVHRQLLTCIGTGDTQQWAAWLGAAHHSVRLSDASLAARDYPAAYQHSQRAMRPLRLLERAHWNGATGSLPSPVSSPAAASFATLPWHWDLMRRMAETKPGANAAPGGDFEDLGTMLTAGWQHFHHSSPGIVAEAELASVAAHSGRYGLRLAARSAEGEHAEIRVESPPSWITGPGVPTQGGEVVIIHGWVRVAEPITGSVDGLLIIDSLSGEPLAERIGRTAGWEEFTLYRVATEQGQVSVTFALSGLGEVWLDDVTIQLMPLSGARSARLGSRRAPGPVPP